MNRGEITRLLQDHGEDVAALDAAMPLLFDEMMAIAHRSLVRERDDHTLSTGALVNEAYLRLAGQNRTQWQSRGHFLSVAAMVMRRILINHAETRLAAKRGGGAAHVSLHEVEVSADADRLQEWVDVDQLLSRFATIDARASRVVECRYFAGLSIQETSEALNISPATVKQDWAIARAWMKREFDRKRDQL